MKIKRQAHDVCQHCQAPKHCFVAEMTVDGQNSLAQEAVFLKKGEILYRQQEKLHGVYLLKSGAIKTYCLDEQGNQTLSDFYLPGELLGFSSIHKQHYVESAQALRDTELCKISVPSLLNRLQKDSSYQTSFLNLLSANLARVEKVRYRYLNVTAAQKVAFFLLDYSQRLVEFFGECLLPTQQDMASYLGLTAETVSRIMKQFQRAGLIQVGLEKRLLNMDGAKLHALTMNLPENE